MALNLQKAGKDAPLGRIANPTERSAKLGSFAYYFTTTLR